MGIYIIKPGMQTSIQDGGRPGFMHKGISRSGAMDPFAMAASNWLVGNPLDNPVLETTLVGPVLEFTQGLTIGICGANFELSLNNNPVPMNKTLNVQKGDVLSFGKRIAGARAYLACAGEWNLPRFFNSYSTNIMGGFGGLKGRALRKDDNLDIQGRDTDINREIPAHRIMKYSGRYVMRCLPCVETEQFSPSHMEQFFSQTYSVSSESNRMGIRLTGNALEELTLPEMISSGLVPGSIQIPPSGLPILSSVDGQTLGGYPRIAGVISADLHLMGQLVAGDKLRFVKVTFKKALSILLRKEELLKALFSP